MAADGPCKTTGRVYDALGRLIWVISDASPTDITGLPSSPPTTTAGWETWARGARSASDSTATQYAYDDWGNLVTQIDAQGRTTGFGYNALGQRTTRTLPDASVERWSYDPPLAGSLLHRQIHTAFDGHSTISEFDTAGRITQKLPLSSCSLAGGSSSTRATSNFNPAGANNAIAFTASAMGTAANGTTVAFIADDANVATDSANVSYDAASLMLTIRYNHCAHGPKCRQCPDEPALDRGPGPVKLSG